MVFAMFRIGMVFANLLRSIFMSLITAKQVWVDVKHPDNILLLLSTTDNFT